MKGLLTIHHLTFFILVLGGLNWLIFGILNWEVGFLFGGQQAIISKIIYILVGLAALYEIVIHQGKCRECEVKA